jgi:hypothetical protein
MGTKLDLRVVIVILSAAALGGCIPYGGHGGDGEPTVDAGNDASDQIDAPPPFDGPRPTDAPPPIDGPPPIDAPPDAPPVPPTIQILTPANNTLITHHDDVILTAAVGGNPVTAITLAVDGSNARADATISGVPADGNCLEGCNVTVVWNADRMREGTHVIELGALGTGGDIATDIIDMRFEDVPEVVFVKPATDERRGAFRVDIEVRVIDRGPTPITGSLSIDGAVVQNLTQSDCLTGCTITRVWDTATLAPRTYPLRAVATDGAGRSTTRQLDVAIGDIHYVSAISVTGEGDLGSLEVEVHLRDAFTNTWLGCSGGNSGLAGVDSNNVTYTVAGWFIDAQRRAIGVEALAGRTLRFEVSEDDFNECPGVNGSGDDAIGSSPPTPVAQLDNLNTAFGNVLALSTRRGRPLAR